MALVEAGDVPGVLRALRELTPEQRTDELPELTARYEDMGREGWNELTDEQKEAMASARLGCHVTPDAAARHLHSRGGPYRPMRDDWMNDVVDLFPPEWRTELVTRLDERVREKADARVHSVIDRVHSVVDHIVRTTGCPMPDSDYWIRGWLWIRPGASAEQLREDPLAPRFLPLILERQTLGLAGMLPALNTLAAEGMVDRAALIRYVFAMAGRDPRNTPVHLETLSLTADERARTAPERLALAEPLIARLLRGGTPRRITPVLAFLRALALTPAENAPFLRDYMAMLDLSSMVAGYGQEILRELDEAGLLEEDALSEACERVLLRSEKKLVRAQLSWLDRVARREPARAGRILTDAARAFQHPDLSLQERALNLVARHLKKVEDPARAELRTAAESLGPGLSARAAELLGALGVAESDTGTGHGTGTESDAGAERAAGAEGIAGAEPVVGAERGAEAEVLPFISGPRPVPGPVGTAAEVAQELAVVLVDDDVVAFERALDGLVRHAQLDRTALCQALEPVMRTGPGLYRDCVQAHLYDVAAAVRGDEPRRMPHLRGNISPYEVFTAPGTMLMARLTEALEVIESGAQPFLLALPTHVTGALDADVLVERVAELESLRIEPAPVDLAQALLRVTPTADEEVWRAAGELRSDAGRRLARWLREGGLPRQDSTPGNWAGIDPVDAPPGRSEPEVPGPDQIPPLPPVAAALVAAYDRHRYDYSRYAAPFWVAQLPHHRDEMAARIRTSTDRRLLACLVEAGGPAGYALHWQIAWRTDGQPDTAVDALLVLAAQGHLDSRLLAGQLQALIHGRWCSLKRVTDALRAAAETGAYATVWSVLEHLLPALLRGTPVRGAGALLALAVECASRCGAKGGIPEVEAVAARPGSSQTVKHARLLRDVLR